MAYTAQQITDLAALETQVAAEILKANGSKFPEANTDYFLAYRASLIRSAALTALASGGAGGGGGGTDPVDPGEVGEPVDGGDPGGPADGTATGRVIILGDSQQTVPPNTGGAAASQRMGLGGLVEVINLSIAGKTLSQFADDMEASTPQMPSAISRDRFSPPANFDSLFDSTINVTVFVTAVTNDGPVLGTDGPQQVAVAKRLVDGAHARGARIVFATCPTRGDSSWTTANEAARQFYNDSLRVNTIGHNGVADWAMTAPIQDGADTSNTQLFNDKLHYQPAVQAVLAPVAAAAVKPTLTGSPYPYTTYMPPRPTNPIAPLILGGLEQWAGGELSGGQGRVPASVQPLSPPDYWSIEADMTFAEGFGIGLAQFDGWWIGNSSGQMSWMNSVGSGIQGRTYDGGYVGDGLKHTVGIEFTPAGAWLYLDGVPLGIITGKNVTNSDMVIGAYAVGNSYPFSFGRISKVRLYSGRRWTGVSTRRAYDPLAGDGSGTT